MRTVLRLALAVMLLFCWLWTGSSAPGAEATDEQILTSAGVGVQGADLLKFFRQRTLTARDQERIATLVRQLGAPSYKVRIQAQKDLILMGPPVLSELRRILQASSGSDLEVNKRIRSCQEIITKNLKPAVVLAALRLVQARKPASATAVLLAYLPFADNKDVEDEVLEALFAVAIKDGKVDRHLTAALKDKHPRRRAAAASLLGRAGDLVYRPALRQLLRDPDAGVRRRAVLGLIGKEAYLAIKERAITDEAILKQQGIVTDDAGLLAFFRQRTLTTAGQARLSGLVRDLGSNSFRVRSKATRDLIQLGSAALPVLRPALADADVEVKSRARQCINVIEKGLAMGIPQAAARLLSRRSAPEALTVLLAYVPFAEEDVEQEVLTALCLQSVRDVKVSPILTAALRSNQAAERAAAAYVLGRVGTAADCRQVRKLVADADPRVRFQVAQLLLAEKDRKAIPVLMGLLVEGPVELALKAEEVLADVTGVSPTTVQLTSEPATRRKVRDAWLAWWKTNEARVDLNRLQRDGQFARAIRARKVTQQCFNAMIQADAAAFKKTMGYPCYLNGVKGRGMDERETAAYVDRLFQMLASNPALKERMKQTTFKVVKVERAEQYLKEAAEREKTFLQQFRRAEVLIVHTQVTQKDAASGSTGAVFVRLRAGRALVIGFGSPTAKKR